VLFDVVDDEDGLRHAVFLDEFEAKLFLEGVEEGDGRESAAAGIGRIGGAGG
jgi:hypothetical protein